MTSIIGIVVVLGVLERHKLNCLTHANETPNILTQVVIAIFILIFFCLLLLLLYSFV